MVFSTNRCQSLSSLPALTEEKKGKKLPAALESQNKTIKQSVKLLANER